MCTAVLQSKHSSKTVCFAQRWKTANVNSPHDKEFP